MNKKRRLVKFILLSMFSLSGVLALSISPPSVLAHELTHYALSSLDHNITVDGIVIYGGDCAKLGAVGYCSISSNTYSETELKEFSTVQESMAYSVQFVVSILLLAYPIIWFNRKVDAYLGCGGGTA